MSDFSSQERWSIWQQHFQSGIELRFSNSQSEKCKRWRLSWNQYLKFSASITFYCNFYDNRQKIINFTWIKGLTGFSTGKSVLRISYEVEKSVAPKQIPSPPFLPVPQSHSKCRVSSPGNTVSFQTSIKHRQHLYSNISTVQTLDSVSLVLCRLISATSGTSHHPHFLQPSPLSRDQHSQFSYLLF